MKEKLHSRIHVESSTAYVLLCLPPSIGAQCCALYQGALKCLESKLRYYAYFERDHPLSMYETRGEGEGLTK